MPRQINFDGKQYDVLRLHLRSNGSSHRINPKDFEGPVEFSKEDTGFTCAVMKEGKLCYITQSKDCETVSILSKPQLKQCLV